MPFTGIFQSEVGGRQNKWEVCSLSLQFVKVYWFRTWLSI